MSRHFKFPDTPNWSNFYKSIKSRVTYDLLIANGFTEDLSDDEKEAIGRKVAELPITMPTLTFKGSEKLHGTNAAVCYTHSEGLYVQGRNRVLTIDKDNMGCAMFVESTKSTWLKLIDLIVDRENIDLNTHTIVLDFEFAGGNIQNNNSACSGIDKSAFLFDHFRVIPNDCTKEDEASKTQYLSTANLSFEPHGIYNIVSLGASVTLTLDLNSPKQCEETLNKLVLHVEDNSPVAEYFDKPDNVGEGVYFTIHAADNTIPYRFKAKGTKHGGKPKQPKTQSAPTSEEVKVITELADKLTPEWRLTQGILETGASEMKDIGKLLKWVAADILKEEMPTITEAGIEWKKVQRYTSAITKQYFIDTVIKDY